MGGIYMKESKNEDEQLRKKAIELYNHKWKVSEICSDLGISKSWFYKWLKRYQSGDENWWQEQSRAPKSKPTKISTDLEQLVLRTRKELESSRFYQYGPQAIYYKLVQSNIEPPPVWTIARILNRNGVTNPRRSTGYISKGKAYPYEYSLCHQIDFIGPRYLATKARYYFFNIICCDTHNSQVNVVQNQNADIVCKCLIRFWKTAGIPDFIQMDNDLAFWGSLRMPNVVGKVIRLCLAYGVTPVFIPVKEPWRNGIIERFNRTQQESILTAKRYSCLEEIQETANQFCEIHNQTHHYSTQGGLTPNQCCKLFEYPLKKLSASYEIPKEPLPIQAGEIHIIRFIRSDLKFHLMGLSFDLPENTKYEYVRGIIITHEHRLIIFKENQYITEFQFMLL